MSQIGDDRDKDRVATMKLVEEPKFDLRDLVAGITRNNFHESVVWGAPRGEEVW